MKAASDLETSKYNEYNHAAGQAHQTWQYYETQNNHVNHVEHQLAGVRDQVRNACCNQFLNRLDCSHRDSLIQRQEEIQRGLDNDKKELHNRKVNKNNHENTKNQAHTIWQQSIASKNLANELKNTADANLKALDSNQIQIQAYLNDLDLKKQQADSINEMLNKLQIQRNEIIENNPEVLADTASEHQEHEAYMTKVINPTVENEWD